MSYSFRLRLLRGSAHTIQSHEARLALDVPGAPRSLRLVNPETDGTLLDAKRLVLTADGFASREEAESAGRIYRDVLTVTLARLRIGANFGDRTGKSAFYSAGLQMLEEQISCRLLNDTHGLMTFESEPRPRFVSMGEATVTLGYEPARVTSTFAAALAAKVTVTDRLATAFQLFNDAFFRQSADSRFLLLMMSIEAMLELQDRDAAAVAHVRKLIEQTQRAAIADSDRRSMIGSLRWMEQESISQAGRRFVSEVLGASEYFGRPASRFFTDCYELRSALVHGRHPYPSMEDVARRVAQLELFVSDLLTTPYLGPRVD